MKQLRPVSGRGALGGRGRPKPVTSPSFPPAPAPASSAEQTAHPVSVSPQGISSSSADFSNGHTNGLSISPVTAVAAGDAADEDVVVYSNPMLRRPPRPHAPPKEEESDGEGEKEQ